MKGETILYVPMCLLCAPCINYLSVSKVLSMSKPIKSFNDYQEVYKDSIVNPETFWGGRCRRFSMAKEVGQSARMGFQQTRNEMVHRGQAQHHRKLSRQAPCKTGEPGGYHLGTQ